MINENQLESLKKKLFRLHFLLTEKESEDSIRESIEDFKLCFIESMSELSNFLTTEYNASPQNYYDILELSFAYKLFNKSMIESLKVMAQDFEKLEAGRDTQQIYEKIRENYAAYLQVIHDMLAKMGQDAEDEDE